eukprot:g637.t1
MFSVLIFLVLLAASNGGITEYRRTEAELAGQVVVMGVEHGHTYKDSVSFAVMPGHHFDYSKSRLIVLLDGNALTVDKEHSVKEPGFHVLEVGFFIFRTAEPSVPQSRVSRINFIIESSHRNEREWGHPLSMPPRLFDVPLENSPWEDAMIMVVAPSILPRATVKKIENGKSVAVGAVPFTVKLFSRYNGLPIRHTVEAFASLRCVHCPGATKGKSTLVKKLPFLLIRGRGIGVIPFIDDLLDPEQSLKQYTLTVSVGYATSSPHNIALTVGENDYKEVPTIISSDISYPAGSALWLPRGAMILQKGSLTINGPSVVMMGSNARIVVSGRLSINGSITQKRMVFVTTPSQTIYWSGIRAQGASSRVNIEGAMFLRGGGTDADVSPRAILHLMPMSTTRLKDSMFTAGSAGTLVVAGSHAKLIANGVSAIGFLSAVRVHKCNVTFRDSTFIGFVYDAYSDAMSAEKMDALYAEKRKKLKDEQNNGKEKMPLPSNLPQDPLLAEVPEFVKYSFADRDKLFKNDGFSGGAYDYRIGWERANARITDVQWLTWLRGRRGSIKTTEQNKIDKIFDEERLFRLVSIEELGLVEKGRVLKEQQAEFGAKKRAFQDNEKKIADRFSHYLKHHPEENLLFLDGGRAMISNSLLFGGVGDCIDIEGQGGTIRIEKSWIEACAREGIAVSVRKSAVDKRYTPESIADAQVSTTFQFLEKDEEDRDVSGEDDGKILSVKNVEIYNTVIAGSQQGIEVGSSRSSEVLVDGQHLLLLRNSVGMRLGDSYPSNGIAMASGLLRCRRCAFIGNRADVWHAQRLSSSRFITDADERLKSVGRIWIHDSLVESTEAAALDSSNVFPKYRSADVIAARAKLIQEILQDTELVKQKWSQNDDLDLGDILFQDTSMVNAKSKEFPEQIVSSAGVQAIVNYQLNGFLGKETMTRAAAVASAAAAKLNNFFGLLPSSTCGHGLYGLTAEVAPLSKDNLSFLQLPYGMHSLYNRLGYTDPVLTSKVLEILRAPSVNIKEASIVMSKLGKMRTAKLQLRSDEPAKFSLLKFCQEEECTVDEYKKILNALSGLEEMVKEEARRKRLGKSCKKGDTVDAIFAGDGKVYKATIQSVNGDNTITVNWRNNDPSHRTVQNSNVFRAGLSCDTNRIDQRRADELKNNTLQSDANAIFFETEEEALNQLERRVHSVNSETYNTNVCTDGGRFVRSRLLPSSTIVNESHMVKKDLNDIRTFDDDVASNWKRASAVQWKDSSRTVENDLAWEKAYLKKWKSDMETPSNSPKKKVQNPSSSLLGGERLFVVILWSSLSSRNRGDILYYLCEERLSRLRVVNIWQFSPSIYESDNGDEWFDNKWYDSFFSKSDEENRVFSASKHFGSGPFQVVLLRGAISAFERSKETLNFWLAQKENSSNSSKESAFGEHAKRVEVLGRVDDVGLVYFGVDGGIADSTWYRPPQGKPTDDLQLLFGLSRRAAENSFFLVGDGENEDWIASRWFGANHRRNGTQENVKSFTTDDNNGVSDFSNGQKITLDSLLWKGVAEGFYRNDRFGKFTGAERRKLNNLQKSNRNKLYASIEKDANWHVEIEKDLKQAKAWALARRPLDSTSQFHFEKVKDCPISIDVYWHSGLALGALSTNTYEILAAIINTMTPEQLSNTSDLNVTLDKLKKTIPDLSNARENLLRASIVAQVRPKILDVLLRSDVTLENKSIHWVKFIVPVYRIGLLQLPKDEDSWVKELRGQTISSIAGYVRRARTAARRWKWNTIFGGKRRDLALHGMEVTLNEIITELERDNFLVKEKDRTCYLQLALKLWMELCNHWNVLQSRGYSPHNVDIKNLVSHEEEMIQKSALFFVHLTTQNVAIAISENWSGAIEVIDSEGLIQALALYLFGLDKFSVVRMASRDTVAESVRLASKRLSRFRKRRVQSMENYLEKRRTLKPASAEMQNLCLPRDVISEDIGTGWGKIHTTREDTLVFAQKLTLFYAQWAPGRLFPQRQLHSTMSHNDLKTGDCWTKTTKPLECIAQMWLGREHTLWIALFKKYPEAAWQIVSGGTAPDRISAKAAVHVVELLETENFKRKEDKFVSGYLEDGDHSSVIEESANDEEELRVDPKDGKWYSRDSFLQHYGSLDEWNVARAVSEKEQNLVTPRDELLSKELKEFEEEQQNHMSNTNKQKKKKKKKKKNNMKFHAKKKKSSGLRFTSKAKLEGERLKFGAKFDANTLMQQARGQRKIAPVSSFRGENQVKKERKENERRKHEWNLPDFMHFKLYLQITQRR